MGASPIGAIPIGAIPIEKPPWGAIQGQGLQGRAWHCRGRRTRGEAWGPSGRQSGKGGLEIGLEVEKGLQTHQLHGLGNPGIAHHQKRDAGVLALLR